MRFMLILKASKDSEAGVMPSVELLTEMGAFNDKMIKAGILVDGAGLQSSVKGARVTLSGDKRTVRQGPFPETSSLVAGYWVINVKSLAEAIEWVKLCPAPHPGHDAEIEIRQMFDTEDFENAPPEVVAQEKEFRSAQRRG